MFNSVDSRLCALSQHYVLDLFFLPFFLSLWSKIGGRWREGSPKVGRTTQQGSPIHTHLTRENEHLKSAVGTAGRYAMIISFSSLLRNAQFENSTNKLQLQSSTC